MLIFAGVLAVYFPCVASVLRGAPRPRLGDTGVDLVEGSGGLFAFPGDVDIYCHIYSDEHEAGSSWVVNQEPEVSDGPDLYESKINTSGVIDAVVNAEEMVMLSKELKAACVGSTWNGTRCQELALAVRHFTWSKMTAVIPGRAFEHLRKHGRVPPVLTFRAGGGVTADVPCRDGKPAHLYFRHIYKAAGYAIKKNLAVLGKQAPDDFIDTNWWQQDYCDKLGYAQKRASPTPILFTFIRDPMEKFIAGYKEISARGEFETYPVHGPEAGTKEHARLFLNNVWHGSCDNGHVLLQVQSMMGIDCESQFDFIGRIESFEDDWQRVGEAAGCTKELDWPEEWTHPSEQDDKGSDASMRAVLAEDGGALAKALCLWLMPDYMAFDYPLPTVCGR